MSYDKVQWRSFENIKNISNPLYGTQSYEKQEMSIPIDQEPTKCR